MVGLRVVIPLMQTWNRGGGLLGKIKSLVLNVLRLRHLWDHHVNRQFNAYKRGRILKRDMRVLTI